MNSVIPQHLSKLEKTIIFDISDGFGNKIVSDTQVPGLGLLTDWDIVVFICRANVVDDTFPFVFYPNALKHVPYVMFYGATLDFRCAVKIWGGVSDYLGVALYPSNPNWSLGIVSIVGYKFK